MSDQILQLPKEGDKVGSGILLSLISTGGSAYIYKTWNEALEIHRAVKVMSPDAPPDVRDRFQTEGRINSKLFHPNIVQCFNYGSTSGGLPYLEMEFISGTSLASLIQKRGPLPLSVSLAISIGLLEALVYAHTVKYTLYDKRYIGLVHRDLKPSNIILTTDGIIKLMDFGIARPVDVSFHTAAGTVPGTVAYMSPEACSGADIDFRSDLYQFGLCLYEFISGQAAFPQTDLTSLLKAKSSNNYLPIESLIKNIDRSILLILKRCLQLDPGERYQSAHSCLIEVRTLYERLYSSALPNQQLLLFLEGKSVSYHRNSKNFKPILYISICFVVLLFMGYLAFLFGPLLLQKIHHFSFVSIQSNSLNEDTLLISPSLNYSQNSIASQPAQHKKAQSQKTNSPVLVSSKKKHSVPVRGSIQSSSISQEDAMFFINQGKILFAENHFHEALSNFQKAIKMPSQEPRQQVVRSCIYWSAKCNTFLYKQGLVPISNYQSSWQSVYNTFPDNSSEYMEASKHLQEFKN